jgi:hypothetical protein
MVKIFRRSACWSFSFAAEVLAMVIRSFTRAPNRCFATWRWRVLIPCDGFSAFYTRAQSLFRDLAMARADGSLRSLLSRLSRIDVLVIDEWAMAPLSEPERRDFWEICEDRYQMRSTILTSQLPVSRWHEQIGDPTLADRILDGWSTTPIGSRCGAIRCGRAEERRMVSEDVARA